MTVMTQSSTRMFDVREPLSGASALLLPEAPQQVSMKVEENDGLDVVDYQSLHESHLQLLHALMESLVITNNNSKNILLANSRFDDPSLFRCIEYMPALKDLPIMKELVEGKIKDDGTFPSSLDEIKQRVFETFGGIKVRVLSPKAFVENNIISISKMRADYLKNDKKWKFPTLSGLDFGTEDAHSYHIVITANNTNMPLAAVRMVIPRIPKVDLPDVDLDDPQKRLAVLRDLEYMAAQNLDISPVDGKSAMEQLANNPISKNLIQLIRAGKFHSIERLVLQSNETFKQKYPDLSYKFFVSVVLPTIMSELAAFSMASKIDFSLVQCDPMFFLSINFLLGSGEGVKSAGEVAQVRSDGSSDTCFTGIVDFRKALVYTEQTNPALSQLTQSRLNTLENMQGGKLLNYNLSQEG